jgi:hypothetical protein
MELSGEGEEMRRARIVRIEWDWDEELDNETITDALDRYTGAHYDVTGEPSFEVKEKT